MGAQFPPFVSVGSAPCFIFYFSGSSGVGASFGLLCIMGEEEEGKREGRKAVCKSSCL